MAKKDLKNLNRRELLQLLLAQAEENERLRSELEQVKMELKNREVVMKEAGTMAEASLQLSGIFDAADAAVKQYVENIHRMVAEQDEVISKRMHEAQEAAYAIIAEANAYSKKKHEEADAYFKEMTQQRDTE